MAKRGRKPKGEYPDKVSIISTRVTAELRQALEAARDESGRSLSQEIEGRLRQSFDIEKTIMETFGDRRTYAFFRTLAGVTDALWNPEKPDRFWLDDPYQYNQAVTAIRSVLEVLRPEGETSLESDSELLQAAAELQGRERAANILEAVRNADPASWSVAERLRTDLGPVSKRIDRMVRVTAREAREIADQLEKAEQQEATKPTGRAK